MDPRMVKADGAGLSDNGKAYAQGVLRRQREFDSAAAAFQRFRAAPAFADWSEGALWAYVRHGFETLPDGRVGLLCRPEIEAAMLGPIFEAMEQVYAGDERGNPFAWLSRIECPVRVATAEKSWPIYKEMAGKGRRPDPGREPVDVRGCRPLCGAGGAGDGDRGAGGVRPVVFLHKHRRPCERRDPYAVPSILWTVSTNLLHHCAVASDDRDYGSLRSQGRRKWRAVQYAPADYSSCKRTPLPPLSSRRK